MEGERFCSVTLRRLINFDIGQYKVTLLPPDALPLPLKMEVPEKKIRWKVAQQAEIRWWQGYLRNRPKQAYLDWKANYWRQFLQDSGYQPTRGERVLAAG